MNYQWRNGFSWFSLQGPKFYSLVSVLWEQPQAWLVWQSIGALSFKVPLALGRCLFPTQNTSRRADHGFRVFFGFHLPTETTWALKGFHRGPAAAEVAEGRGGVLRQAQGDFSH